MEPKFLQSKKVGENKKEQQKKKIQIVVLIILVVFMVFLAFKTFFGGPKRPPRPAQTPVGAPGQVPTSIPVIPVAAEKPAIGDDWGTSPFSLKKEEKPTVSKAMPVLELQGVVYGPDRESYAIVNEKILKKGNAIADNTVKEIYPDYIVLEDSQGETVELRQ